MSESAGQAVFPSYASQDAAVTARIAEALRQGGLEVWLDQGGRPRRRRCVGSKEPRADRPVRAVRAARLHHYAVAQGRLSPAAVASRRGARAADGQGRPVHRAGKSRTSERGALVPDAFLAVPWTKLQAGEAPAAFGARAKKTARAARSGPVFPSLVCAEDRPGLESPGHADHADDQPRPPHRRPATPRLQSLSRPTPQPSGSTNPMRAASDVGRLRRWLRSYSRRGLPSRIFASRRRSHRRPFASRRAVPRVAPIIPASRFHRMESPWSRSRS